MTSFFYENESYMIKISTNIFNISLAWWIRRQIAVQITKLVVPTDDSVLMP